MHRDGQEPAPNAGGGACAYADDRLTHAIIFFYDFFGIVFRVFEFSRCRALEKLYGPQTENPDPKRGQNGTDLSDRKDNIGMFIRLLCHKLPITRGF